MISKQREAFSLITAIFVMIIMAGITALVMGTAGKIVKETTSQYQKEQAMLLAKSYTELAIMTVMSNSRAGTNCIYEVGGVVGPAGAWANGEGYQAEVRISYIGNATEVGNCVSNGTFSSTVVTPNSSLNIIVDAYIHYHELDNLGRVVTYHRRTLQKI